MNIAPNPRACPKTIVERLRSLAEQRPHDIGLIVIREQGGAAIDRPISYAELDERVRALAAQLQSRFTKGDRALLLLDNDDHHVVAFFACLYAGLIAVPVFPPESARPQHLARLIGIAADAQATCVLTSCGILEMVGAAMAGFSGATALAVDAAAHAAASDWRPVAPNASDIAFLQYTSGSTSAPKGVMVTHGNLMANERLIEEGMSVGDDDAFISWLPLYHDMGLIGGLLQPIHRGVPVGLMTPKFFLERPVRWLEAISRQRATISGGPDFAFRLCLDRVKPAQCAGLDLSSWRVAFSGAEPVRHDTLLDFIERFAPIGFPAQAVYPCYGLAEATLLVAGVHRGAGMLATAFDASSLARGRPHTAAADAAAVSTLVACGRALTAHRIEIVDPLTFATVAAGAVGEIWFSGPSIAQGYWRRQDESAATFIEHRGRRWLRTGDLGFVHGQQLYITGRIKDLIIVRGQNLYPQDIERAVEAEVEAARKGRVAAFAVPTPDGREGVGVALEVSRGAQKRWPAAVLVDAVNQAVVAACREPAAVVMLLNPGALPKTSSGKLQRGACRDRWRERSLDAHAVFEHGRFVQGGEAIVAAQALSDEVEALLAGMWRAVLKHDADHAFTRDAHFFSAGGNSLAAAQLAARIATQWSVDFPSRAVFEHPRLQDMAEALRCAPLAVHEAPAAAVARLSPHQRALPMRLSPAQQRQWLLWQLDPSSTAYHLGGTLRFDGAIFVPALRSAFDSLVARHESLRTVFRIGADGLPEQQVLSTAAVAWSETDLRNTDAADAEARVSQTVDHVRRQPFDLMQGPLLRLALIHLGDRESLLAVVMHHIVSDGDSMEVLIDELAEAYQAHVRQEPPRWADLPIQYIDHAAWQRSWLAGGEGRRQAAYWREQLGGEQPVLALPTDHARHAMAGYHAATFGFELSADLLEGLRGAAHAQGATLFMVLLAGLQALLHRYAGQDDIRVGVPVANRPTTGAEGIIGLFVNTLVLRNRLTRRMPLNQVLVQARRAALEAQAHQDLPFDQLVEALQPARSLGHSPLFQVMFNHRQQRRRSLAQWPGLAVEVRQLEPLAAQFEWVLDTVEQPDGQVAARITYARELFEPSTVSRMAHHYLAMLTAFARGSDQAVGDVALLSEDERAQLQHWGVNRLRHPALEPVHRLIERQARDRPEATALLFEQEALSFRQLNVRANRLAHRLIRQGVKHETRVGIAMERSTAMVVGLLAILKAGGTYLPLDPELPAERLAYMVDDGGVELLLTQSELLPRFAGISLATVLTLDRLDLSDEEARDPRVDVQGDSLAYVIYTSGSTGKPKGVMVRHLALSHFLVSMQAAPGMTAQDTVVAVTSLSFDIAALEIYLPLITGARLVLAGLGVARDGAALARLLQTSAATVLQSTPSGWRLLRSGGWPATPLGRFKGLCGGEALPVDLAEDLQALGVELWNMYGPTETTIWSTAGVVHGAPAIGGAIPGTQLHVLDADLNAAPTGVMGELYLGGVGLGRGYLNRPGLSAERFVADPFDAEGGRLYRTGDLVRWNAQGELEYLGRIDHQVKIRGFRIELGEVESQLLAQPEVREAVVVAQERAQEGPGGASLVGYVSAQAGHSVEAASLRERLGQALPEYMVPTLIVVLDRLPLNANGKVDRKALPLPRPDNDAGYDAPRGAVEEALAAMWAEVLDVRQVGRQDNFFALGGHSLRAAQLVSRVRAGLRADVPLRTVFEHPVLHRLAAAVQSAALHGVESQALGRVPRVPDMPLSPAQRRLWVVDRLARAGHSAYNMATALRLSGRIDLDKIRAALGTVLERHEVLRTTYPENEDGDPVSRLLPAEPVALPVVDLSGLPLQDRDRQLAQALEAQAEEPFDLASGPVLRASVQRLGEHLHVLFLCVHHIAFDGWSAAIFVKEFVAAYEAFATGSRPQLPALPIQYADYADWHARRLEAELPMQARFWKHYLEGAPARSTLAGEGDLVQASGAANARSDTVVQRLTGRLADSLNALAHAQGTSLFTVLLAGFQLVLHRVADADDLVLGTDVAGRSRPELEALIGFFVNVVPLRSRRVPGLAFPQWLSRTQESTLSALEHQDVPFDQIVELAGAQRAGQAAPLVQVLFVMQNTPAWHFALPGLEVQVVPPAAVHAKFDLAVFVSESAGGLQAEWMYSPRLYRRGTVEQVASSWQALLERVAASPNALLDDLLAPTVPTRAKEKILDSTLNPVDTSSAAEPPLAKLSKLAKLKRIADPSGTANVSSRPAVRTSFLSEQRQFPLVMDAAGSDIDGIAWAREQREAIDAALCRHGGVLFRNFGLRTPQDFEAFAEVIEPQLYGSYGDLPKKEGGRNTYRSTPYPEREMILFHNESAHLGSWPRKQWFFCEVPSRVGGATPIVDCREMLRRLPKEVVDSFERKQLLYVRTFTSRLDVSWQDFFKTDRRSEVEARLSAAGTEWQWLSHDELQTRTRCPAVITHPVTGDRVFFNQVQLHHPSCLDPGVRADLLAIVGPDRLPRQVCYGDGTPIGDDVMALVGRTYEECAVRFDWRQGDVVMLDNMLAAHARDPFEGERKIVVAMGAMCDRASLEGTRQPASATGLEG